MAETKIFDQVESASKVIRKPVPIPGFVNPLAPDYKPLPAPYARGFQSNLKGLKGATGGLVALAGHATGIDRLKQYGLDVAERAGQEAAELAMPVENIDSKGGFADFAKFALGHGTASALTMLATGGLGRAGGAALARGVPDAAEKLLLKNAGATTGLAGGIFGQELGGIYPEAVANGIPDAAARSVLGATASTGLDLIGPAVLARKLGLFGKTTAATGPRTIGSVARGVGKGAAVQGGIEAPTEVAQEVIGNIAAGSPLADEQAISNYLNAAALALVPSGVTGGVAGGVQAYRRGAAPVAPPAVAPVAPPGVAAAPVVAPPAEAQPFAGPPVPSPFQAAPASAAEIVQEPDRLALQDISPAPITQAESDLLGVQDRRAAITSRLPALDAEEKLPKAERRSKQEIITERRALQTEATTLVQRESNLKTLAEGPEYQPKTGSTRPTIIGEQPTAAATGPISDRLNDIPFDTAEFAGAGQPIRRKSGFGKILDFGGRKLVVVDVNGVKVPFYLSTGHGGKADVTSGKWYPVFGISTEGWLNKSSGAEINNYYGSPEFRAIAAQLDTEIGDVRGDDTHQKVSLSGKHVDFINSGLGVTAVENGTSNAPAQLAKNIKDVVSRATTKLATPTAAQPQDIITLEQDKILRQARGAQSVETQLALSKKARGALLSSDEAKAVRQYEATAPKVEPVISSSRGTVKQPGGVQARENFVNAYTAGVEKTVADLAAQVQMAPAKLASIKTALNRAAERAVKEDTPEKAQQVLSAGFEAAMKGKLPQQDIDTFAQKLTEAVTSAAPEIVQRNFSQAAIVPADKVVFSHWGNVPGGTTDPTKIGTGVPGVDQAAAKAVGLSYTSAVVRGSAYTEPAVTSRTPFVGQLSAEKVYQADKNDPLLAQARAEIAPQFGPDENVAWMQYAKKVRDLGYDAIQYANGQLRVFTAQPVFQTPRAAEIRKAASVAADLHGAFGGSSYNVVTGQNLAGTINYAVSPYSDRELIIPGKDVPAETFEKFIKANEDLLGDPRNILGSWFKDGDTYIDVSVVTESYAEAMRIAEAANQQAIFSLRTFEEIATGTPLNEDMSQTAAARFGEIMAHKGIGILNTLESLVGTPTRLTAKIVSTVEGGTGKITFGQARDVIEFSIRAKDGDSLAAHEGFHYLETRALSDSENTVIARALKRGSPLHKDLMAKAREYDKVNGTDISSEIMANPREARAYGFEFWYRGDLTVNSTLARIWQKIVQMGERVANMIRGDGFQSHEDIFKAIKQGVYARKGDAGLRSYAQPAFSTAAGRQTESAAFKKWFGDSKVVDADGKPLVVYHGTTKDVASFDTTAGMGAYFSGDTGYANAFTSRGGSRDGGNVMPVYLSIKNPASDVELGQAIEAGASGTAAIRAALEKRGFDGLIHRDEMVAFNPTQIKSATGNRGTFDAADPNILFSQAATDQISYKVLHENLVPRYGIDATDATTLNLGAQADASGNMRVADINNAVQRRVRELRTMAVEEVFKSQEAGSDGMRAVMAKLAGSYKYRAQQLEALATDSLLSGGSTLFSQAATDQSLAELTLRADAGEIQRTQLNILIAEVMDGKDTPRGLRDKLFDPAVDELKAVGGSLKRFRAEYAESGLNLSRKSAGYNNAFNVLSAYNQRKSVLISRAIDSQLSLWVKGASRSDKVIVSAALLKRTENEWARESAEVHDLRLALPKHQRDMFDQATDMIATQLDAELAADAIEYRRLLTDDEAFGEWYSNRSVQVEQMKDKGYFPERRYGDHVVHAYVMAPDGKKVTAYFSQHEREATARKELDDLNRLAGNEGLTFEYGYKYRAEHGGAISFGQFLATAERTGVALTQPEKERIGRALISADSTRRNRVFRRQNIAGYDQNGLHVLSEFGVTMANKIAYSEFGVAISDSMAGVQVDVSFDNKGAAKIDTLADTNMWAQDGEMSGFYRNLMDRNAAFVLSPKSEPKIVGAAKLMGTAHFLGGSIAAVGVQLSALPMITIPWLTQHTTVANASGKTLSALRTVAANFSGLRDLPTLLDDSITMPGISEVEGLRHALQVAAQDGTTLPTEVYSLMGLSRGQEYSFSGAVQKAVELWMTPFKLAEETNRMVSFIAGYKIAKENGLDNEAAYALAKETVDSTQFRYDDVNRPGVLQSSLGSLLFMFKAYPVYVVETLVHLAKVSPHSAAFMLGALWLTAGVQGMPGAEDLMDLIDTIAFRIFKSPFQSKRWVNNLLKTASEAVVGADLSTLLMHGIANSLTGMNLASRTSLGNMLPGTGIGLPDADYKAVLSEVMGAPASYVTGLIGGADALSRGDFTEAARKALPLAMQNVIKGSQAWTKGYAVDIGGRKLMDLSGWEAFAQTIGFSPAGLGAAYDTDRINRRSKAFHTQMRRAYQKEVVKAYMDGDTERVKEAVASIKAWGKANPDMDLGISSAALRRQIQQAGMTLSQRTMEGMPRELRANSEAALGLDEEE